MIQPFPPDRSDFRAIAQSSDGMKYETVYGHSTTLGKRIRAELASGPRGYSTAVDQPTMACAERLPWMQQDHWKWQRQRGQRHHVLKEGIEKQTD